MCQLTVGVSGVLSCVIIVENLPVPFDRRVWQEATALRDAGWRVSVICPKTKKYPLAFESVDGISVYRHPLPLEARGKFGFVVEYLSALFHECRLLAKIAAGPGFDVIQVCNPPDLLFLNALPYKLFGKRLVFDLHDLCPELLEAKFGRRRLLRQLLLGAEKLTIKAADQVVCANDTYREIAIARGGKRPEDVVAVYSVPRQGFIRRVEPDETLRRGARVVIGYMGVIADQDGVDHFIQMMDCLVNGLGRKDLRAVVVGDGPARASVSELADRLGLSDAVTFTGYLSGDELMAALSAFDIGIIPDPLNPYNDKISMNKVFEYSALGIPSVAYPLHETRRLLGSTARYSGDATPAGLARACLTLIDDDATRLACGREAKALADERFNWPREREKYVAAYARLARERPVELGALDNRRAGVSAAGADGGDVG
jgi:glycosyltransferase involved in cell wall biosynthesis